MRGLTVFVSFFLVAFGHTSRELVAQSGGEAVGVVGPVVAGGSVQVVYDRAGRVGPIRIAVRVNQGAAVVVTLPAGASEFSYVLPSAASSVDLRSDTCAGCAIVGSGFMNWLRQLYQGILGRVFVREGP